MSGRGAGRGGEEDDEEVVREKSPTFFAASPGHATSSSASSPPSRRATLVKSSYRNTRHSVRRTTKTTKEGGEGEVDEKNTSFGKSNAATTTTTTTTTTTSGSPSSFFQSPTDPANENPFREKKNGDAAASPTFVFGENAPAGASAAPFSGTTTTPTMSNGFGLGPTSPLSEQQNGAAQTQQQQPMFTFGRDLREESSASPMSVVSEGTPASLNYDNGNIESPSSFPGGFASSPGFTFGQQRRDEDPSPPNPAWAHIKTPTEFSPSMFADTHPGVTSTTIFNTTPPGSANGTSTPLIFQSGGSDSGNFSGSSTKPKSYKKDSYGKINRAKGGSSNSSGGRMHNSNSSTNSNRMQEIPSDGMEAAKIAAQVGTSFREDGPLSPQAVLNNSFSKVTIGGESNNISSNSSSPFPTSAFNVGHQFHTDRTPTANEGVRKPFKKFAVKSPGSPKSPTTTGGTTNAFGRTMRSSPSSRNSPPSGKELEKMANVEKDVKAYKLEANALFQEASSFVNQEKDELALKKFRAARDTYTRAIIMLESIAPSPDKHGSSSSSGNNGTGAPFLPTRQLLGREAGTLLSNRAASTLMVIQIEESRERAKEMDGKYTPDMLWKYRQKIQECIDDCMRARKADATYMKPILRQAKCHERLADFTAACACYTTVVSSSKASEKEKEEARVELEHAKRLRIISDVNYLTEARRALRKIPINGGESLAQNELMVKSAITDAKDIENRATHMPLDIRQIVACVKTNALMICGQYKEALDMLESFDFFASSSPTKQKGSRNKSSPPRVVELEDDMAVRENIIEMTLLRIVAHYGLGDVDDLERFAKQTNGFTGPQFGAPENNQSEDGSEHKTFTMLDTFNAIRPDSGAIFAVLKDQYDARMCGNSAFSSGEYHEAEMHYTKCIAASNSSLSKQFVTAILCNRAAARMGAQKYIDAMLDCGRAIILDPTRAKAYSRRAAIFSHLRLFDKALEDLIMYEKTAGVNGDPRQIDDAKSRTKELKAVEIKLEQQYGESAPIHARAILGLSDDSSSTSLSDSDVTKAFKKLSLRAHADKVFHPNELPSHFVAGNEDVLKLLTEDANRVFNHLNVAKDALKTSADRRSHDASEYQWDSTVSVQRRRASSSSNSAGSRYAGRRGAYGGGRPSSSAYDSHFEGGGGYEYYYDPYNNYYNPYGASSSSSSRGGHGSSGSGRNRRSHRR